MRSFAHRTASVGAALALSAGVLGGALVAAPAASAATGSLTITVAGGGGSTTGNNFNVAAFTTPAACSGGTRQVTKVRTATATNPADQAAIAGWEGRNMYSPTGTNVGAPLAEYPSSQNMQSLANGFGLTLVPGTWVMDMLCTSTGGTVFDTYTGTIVWDSPTAWHAVNTAPSVATQTTLTASPSSVQVGASVTLTATVTASDSTVPGGSVAFTVGSTTLGTAAVDPSGKATLTTTNLQVGSNDVVATFSGAGYDTSVSSPATVTVTAAPAADTTTTLAVSPLSGPAFQPVTLTGTVSPSGAAGQCTFKDGTTTIGSAPVSSGTCAITLSSFGIGDHPFSVAFAPTNTQAFNASTSSTETATYTASQYQPDPQTVVVTVPQGTLAISTPYTPSNPLDLGTLALRSNGSCYDASAPFDKVTVTDTRAGQLGWSAFLTRADFSNGTGGAITADREALRNVTAHPIAGNALQSISVNDVAAGGSNAAVPAKFASAPAGASVGSIDVKADFALECVPTSVTPGLYTATVIFTVS